MTSPVITTKGAAIRARRFVLGISQAELAARVGMNASYLSQIERGGATGAPRTLARIAAELGVSVEDIITVAA